MDHALSTFIGFRLFNVPITLFHVVAAGLIVASIIILLLMVGFAGLLRARKERREAALSEAARQRDMDEKMAEIARQGAELTGRLRAMSEHLGSRQADLARLVSERLDNVSHRMGQNLEASSQTTGEHLTKLNERLAVIDAAQARLTGLTQEVVGLKDILANKQSRGAFGQGRMEAIIRDCLPPAAFEFQYTLSNRNRPDCIIRLPGDDRVMVIDAKFPLESFTALKGAASEEALKQAQARVRGDVGKHIKDIAEKYFVPGETQDIAVLFVPSESLYADLNEHFEDLVQKAHKARVIIVSPSLLMMAVQVMQAIVRDANVREQAHLIQDEVRLLVEDVGRLRTRVAKLDAHFRQAQEDIGQITTSADKITKRGERIDLLDFSDHADAPKQSGLLAASFIKAAE
jgi:DNA recombination protein RmuC